MVVTLEVDGTRPSDVVAGASPIAELLACLHAHAEPEHHPESRAWLAAVRERLPDDLLARLNQHAPLWARYRCRLLFPLHASLDRDLSAELDTLLHLDLDVFVQLAAVAIRGIPFPGDDQLDGDDQRRAFIKMCERRSFSRGDLARFLVDDPAAFRADLVDTLQNCATVFFDSEWSRIGPHLTDVAARVRDQLHTDDLPTVLAALSPTATIRAPGRVSYDKLQTASGRIGDRGCLVVPTLHGWPHLILKTHDTEMPIVVHFIAGDFNRPQVSQALVRERLAAIAEPARLELCRHLLGEPITTSELAQRMELAEPQVSRHLRRLRDVGLVTSQREGRLVYHRLHARLLLNLGMDVLSTIMR
jgi:DNA-binding transcriptional ArsR family regulator